MVLGVGIECWANRKGPCLHQHTAWICEGREIIVCDMCMIMHGPEH